ncbi:MAG: hypothetical protein KF716_21635 [Anaerolineae bacterium]|nr:hypothetical protein [Anaerolineae bacterium]
MSNHPIVRRLAYSMLWVYVILFLVIIFLLNQSTSSIPDPMQTKVFGRIMLTNTAVFEKLAATQDARRQATRNAIAATAQPDH